MAGTSRLINKPTITSVSNDTVFYTDSATNGVNGIKVENFLNQKVGGLRQSILSCPVDSSGNPNYITSSGLTVTLNVSPTSPFIATIADGFNTDGTLKDYIVNLTSNVSQTLLANGTFVLGINKTNGLPFIFKSVYMNNLNSPPSNPYNNCMYFNTSLQNTFQYNTDWKTAEAVNGSPFLPIAIITTNATSVTNILYPMLGSSPVEFRHYIGNPGEPAFQNGWVNFDADTYSHCAFYKDNFGVVHLEGFVKSGTSTIFTLPTGYRPPTNLQLNVNASDSTGRILIQTDGAILLSTGTNTFVTLDGITFRT